jgi:hypothetical protein
MVHRLLLRSALRGTGGLLAKRGGVAVAVLPRSLLVVAAGAARARPRCLPPHQALSAAFSAIKERSTEGEGEAKATRGSDRIRSSAAARGKKNELDKKGEKFTSAEIVRKLLK